MTLDIKAFFDKATFTVSYVVADPETDRCAILDSVLDYDPKSGRTDTKSADEVIAYVKERGFTVDLLLETHVHADHLSAAPYLKKAVGGEIVIGDNIRVVQGVFSKLFNAEDGFPTDGRQFNRLVSEGDTLTMGSKTWTVMHTPGHTPACMTYLIEDAAFVGDTLFMPDFGTARCDFPGGDARQLYRSIQRLLALPPETRLFMCHDYAPGGREYKWETTVAEEREANIHLKGGVTEDAFVEMRTARDKQLAMPVLLLPSVQVNMRAGELPPPEDNGVSYLKIPLNAV